MLTPEQTRYIFNSGLNKNEQIEALLDLEFSTRDIQLILKCSPNTISKVKKSIDETGSPPSMGKIGRPTKKTKEIASLIVQETSDNPYISASDLQYSVSNKLHSSIGQTTINNFRNEIGFKFLPPLNEPLLTPQHIEKRINFCYSILKNRNNLPVIGFSDESRFSLGSDKRWLWRRRNERNPNTIIKKEKYAFSIMVWGMIGYGYKPPLYILDCTENSEKYQEIIIDNSYLIDAMTFYEGNFALQQDGASPHMTHSSIDAISNVCNLLINWPPNSPDLNVIEMIWSIMEKYLNFIHPNNEEELRNALNMAWDSINIDIVNKLCESFVKRCFLCLQNRGKCIQHLITKGMDVHVSDDEIENLFETLKNENINLNEIELILPKIE